MIVETELFTGIKSDTGRLEIKIADTKIGFSMPKNFWNMIVKKLDEFKNSKDIFIEELDRDLIDDVKSRIKIKLKEKLF